MIYTHNKIYIYTYVLYRRAYPFSISGSRIVYTTHDHYDRTFVARNRATIIIIIIIIITREPDGCYVRVVFIVVIWVRLARAIRRTYTGTADEDDDDENWRNGYNYRASTKRIGNGANGRVYFRTRSGNPRNIPETTTRTDTTKKTTAGILLSGRYTGVGAFSSLSGIFVRHFHIILLTSGSSSKTVRDQR